MDKIVKFRIVAESLNNGAKVEITALPEDPRPVELKGLTTFEEYTVSIYTTNAQNAQHQGGGEGSPKTTEKFQTWPAGLSLK